MSILILKPGILTTVQDLGRYGFRRFGINPGGAMDPAAVRLLNLLLCNDENAAVLEMHFPAPRIVFQKDAMAAVGGADFLPHLDGAPINNWQRFSAPAGSTLTFGNKVEGNRAYLAIQGGIAADRWLNSSSTNIVAGRGGSSGKRLDAGDRLELESKIQAATLRPGKRISSRIVPRYSRGPTVRVLAGAEFHKLSKSGRKAFPEQHFEITPDSNRMGFRLKGEPVKMPDHPEILSSAVGFGTIQALPDGQLIVLMADHQTTGGYPRLAHVISRDLPLIGQLGPGDKVNFKLISNDETEALALEFERDLNFLRIGSKFDSFPN
jgi:antagonist of KipI